ncbi:hypothetical protein REPUB_Repub13aG0025600 [Reevesia pubescens]
MKNFMKAKENEKNKRVESSANVAAGDSDYEVEVLMVQEEKKDTRDVWVFDSAYSQTYSLGYGYSAQEGGMNITKCSRIVMNGVENSKTLYEFMGSTIKGGKLMSSCQVENKNVNSSITKKVTFTNLVKRWSY